MTLRPRRNRPRFNGSDDDHAATELLAAIKPAPEDEAAIDRIKAAGYAAWDHRPDRFAGGSDLGVMPGGVMVIEVAGRAPLAGYRPEPASFPALQAAPVLTDEYEVEALPVLAPVPVTEPAKFGDAIHLPVIWCDMPRCIGWFHDPASPPNHSLELHYSAAARCGAARRFGLIQKNNQWRLQP